MNKIEALRKEADLREMCEGTTVQWWECVRSMKHKQPFVSASDMGNCWHYNLEFALAIVENKPVFIGDELYFNGEKVVIEERHGDMSHKSFVWKSYSWNPPKPKTVMVELSVNDAEFWSAVEFNRTMNSVMNPSIVTYADWREICPSNRFYEACRKALEQLNGDGK